MIKDFQIIGCENCPKEMMAAADLPWYFLGEVRETWNLNIRCEKCNRPDFLVLKASSYKEVYKIHTLQKYLFITDEMLEVIIYWGCCRDCRRIYWARVGPPFKRVRALISELME